MPPRLTGLEGPATGKGVRETTAKCGKSIPAGGEFGPAPGPNSPWAARPIDLRLDPRTVRSAGRKDVGVKGRAR